MLTEPQPGRACRQEVGSGWCVTPPRQGSWTKGDGVTGASAWGVQACHAWDVPEKPNERAARQVVAKSLGVRVSRYEDGKTNSQVDALIHATDGVEALEIVADHEAAFNAQWDALTKIGHTLAVPGLRRGWSAQLARAARIKDVAQQLPDLILAFQDERDRAADSVDEGLPEGITRLGVRMLYPLEGGAAGRVNLHAEGWGGFTSNITMARYVEQVLDSVPDVPHKLSLHPAPTKHAFIWTTIGSDYRIQAQLERGRQAVPTDPPTLPAGVTHVWVVGSFTTQGALAWFPDQGWWRPDWSWSDTEPMRLNENESGDALPEE